MRVSLEGGWLVIEQVWDGIVAGISSDGQRGMDVGRAETFGAVGGWGRESAVAAGTRAVRVGLGGG